MRTRPAGRLRRSLFALVLAGLIGVLTLVGAAPATAADPTPTPTPAATATPTSPSAQPVPSSPSLRPSAPSTAEGKRSARTVVLPARLQRLLDLPRPPAARHARLRVAAAATDDRIQVTVVASCAAGGPTHAGVVVVARVTGALTVPYAVTGPDGEVTRGTAELTADDGYADLEIGGLDRGSFSFTTYLDDAETASTTTPFTVIGCVDVVPTCQGLSFTNPDDNPAVAVEYGAPLDAADPTSDGVIELAPGATETVRTPRAAVHWTAYQVSADGAAIALAGQQRSVAVEQECAGAVASSGTVGCSAGSAPAVLDWRVSRLPTDALRYEVTDENEDLVASGDAAADGSTSHEFRDTLPATGRYTYRLYLGSDAQPFETAALRALGCLPVKTSCRSITFTNPAENPAVRLRYDVVGRASLRQARVVGAAGSTTFAWTAPRLAWLASAASGRWVELAGASTAAAVAVPQGCASGGGSGHSGSADHAAGGTGNGAAGGRLAATGPVSGTAPLLVAGLLLSLGGAGLLRRRRSAG